MPNPTKEELIEKLKVSGLNDAEVEATFVELFGTGPDNIAVTGPLPSPKKEKWLRPAKQDVTPTQKWAAVEAEKSRRVLEDAKVTEKTGLGRALAGAAYGVGESIADLTAYTRDQPEDTEKEIGDSFTRQEEFLKSRLGATQYENFYHDAMDLITLVPNLGALAYDAATSGDSFEKARRITKAFTTDSATVYPFLYNNWERSVKAAPLATILASIPALKAAGGLSKLGSKGARMTKLGDAIHKKVEGLVDAEVELLGKLGPTQKGKTTFRVTGEDVTPGVYKHSLGDRGITYRDMLRAGTKGAAVGAIAGGVPTAIVGSFIGGAGLSVLAGKLNRTGLGGAFANSMGRLLSGISSNTKVSNELAMRNLFARGPEAEAKLQAIGAKVAQRLRQGEDVLDGELMGMAKEAFPDLISEIEFTRAGRRYDQKPEADVAERARKRAKLPDDIEKDLANAEGMLENLLGGKRARRTTMLMDDLLSEGSVQFGRVHDVRAKALEIISNDLGRKLTTAEKTDLAKAMETVSNTPFHREAGINLRLMVGGQPYYLRDIVTKAHRSLKPKRRKEILAGLAADIITSNRADLRKQSFARAAADSSDKALQRLGLTQEGLAAMKLEDAVAAFGEAVAADVIVNRGSVPLVGPTAVRMESSGRYLRSLRQNDPDKMFAIIQEKLGGKRELTPGEKKVILQRMDDVADEMIDSHHKDIASEGARAAEGYYADVDRGTVYSRLDDLINNDHLSPEDVAKVKSFFDSVDNSRKVIEDNRSMRGPLTEAFKWLHANDNNRTRLNRLVSSHIKGSYTTRNVNAHINNNMSNLGLLSYDRGLDPLSVIRGVVKDTRSYNKWLKGNRSGMSDRDMRMMKQVDRGGFAAGDFAQVEIKNLARMENMPERLKTNPLIAGVARSGVVKGAKKIDDIAAGAYRLGDVGPKINEALHSMRAIFSRIDRMTDGQTWEFRTSPVSTTTVTRKGNGLFIGKRKIADFVQTKDGMKVVGNKLDDLVGQHGRLRANERFFDYRDRPGILRLLDQLGGPASIINPYLTWAWKASGIGGKGLFSVVNKIDSEYKTNKLSSLMREDALSAAKWYRRAIAANALRSQFSQNPAAMREALGFQDTPGSPLSVLINRMAGPDVVEMRSVESMNPFSRQLLTVETLLGMTQDMLMKTGLLRDDVAAQRKAQQLLGETGTTKRALKLGMVTGSPAEQLVRKVADGKSVSARELLALVIGQTPALGVSAVTQLTGGPEDSAFVMINERLPKNLRQDAMDFYFRKMFNYGWDSKTVLTRKGKARGRLNNYFAGIKTRVTTGYYKDLLDDYRRGKLTRAEVNEAAKIAQDAYRERFDNVNEAYNMVTGKNLPPKLKIPPKINWKKATRNE
jgi:hypothetical protein